MDEIIELIDKYWRFDNNQQPMSSWHDKQDLLELLRTKQTGTNTLVSGSCDHQEVKLVRHAYKCKKCNGLFQW